MAKGKQLTFQHRNIAKVCFALTIVALVLRKLNELGGQNPDEGNPAVSQCIAMIDELLEAVPEDDRKVIVERINKSRLQFTREVKKLSAEAGLVGSLEVLTGGMFVSRKGTRLDFIIGTFEKNLATIKERMKYNENEARKFAVKYKKAINEI